MVVSVNRHCHVDTAEGEPGEEDCSNEAGGYCPAGGTNQKRVWGSHQKFK